MKMAETWRMSAVEGGALVTALGLLAAFVFGAWLLNRLLSVAAEKAAARRPDGPGATLLNAIRRPLGWAVGLVGVVVAYAQSPGLPRTWDGAAHDLFFIAFMLVIYVGLYRLVRDGLTWYGRRGPERAAETPVARFVPFLRRVLVALLTLIMLGALLQYFKLPLGSFVATLGIGSLAVALAAQAALGDLISGFLIITDRPYRIGDRIELLDAGLLGDVVDIGLRSTRVLTLDNRMVVVPNSLIAGSAVVNHAYPDPNLRVDLPIGVAYGTDIHHAKAVLLAAVRRVEGVQQARPPTVVLQSFGDSAINLEVRCWIDAFADRPIMVDRINMAIYDELNAAGIEIPFPQHTLWHRVEAEAVPLLRAAFRGKDGTTSPPRSQTS